MPTTNTNNNPAQTPYTAAELDERTKYRRAVEAVIWGMPLVNTEAMRQAYLRDVGATYNDICYFSRPADWRFQVTTPNASTNYVYFNVNLTQGPVVIEVPEPVGAGLLGGMLDAWDVTIAGVGPADENNGKAAKYLLLPPGDTSVARVSGSSMVRSVTVTMLTRRRRVTNGSPRPKRLEEFSWRWSSPASWAWSLPAGRTSPTSSTRSAPPPPTPGWSWSASMSCTT
jgi:hypothetical protein